MQHRTVLEESCSSPEPRLGSTGARQSQGWAGVVDYGPWMVPAPQHPWESLVQAAQLLPWLSLCLGEQPGAGLCVSAFLSLSFSTVALVTEQRMAVHDGPVGWSPSHGSPSSCPASLTSGRDFWDCFLTWPGVQWELFNLNENAETFRSQKKEKMPWGTRCGSWWFSLGFYQRTGLPCLAT